MRVILLVDVDKLGKVGEVKDVSDGYGRNFLIQYRKAVIADGKAIKQLEEENTRKSQKKQSEESKRRSFIISLSSERVVVKAEANADGKLYGAIGVKEILEALQNKEGIEKKHIIIDNPIRELGKHKVEIKFSPNLKSDLNIIVERI